MLFLLLSYFYILIYEFYISSAKLNTFLAMSRFRNVFPKEKFLIELDHLE